MTTSQKRFSVVVPVRDGAATLPACLAALSALRSPPGGHEVVIVDNGSRDGSGDAARTAGFRVVPESREGSYAARNAGVMATAGEIVVFTDADCAPEPDWLVEIARVFENGDVVVACGEILAAPPTTFIERYSARAGLLGQSHALGHRFRPFAQTANAAFRRDALQAVGLFDASFRSGGDADLCWRIGARFGAAPLLVPGARVRHRHRTSLGSLWRQFARYGSSDVALFRKYRGELRPSVAKAGADFLRIVFALPLSVLGILRMPREGLLGPAAPLLRAFRSLARRWGQVREWFRPAPGGQSRTSMPMRALS